MTALRRDLEDGTSSSGALGRNQDVRCLASIELSLVWADNNVVVAEATAETVSPGTLGKLLDVGVELEGLNVPVFDALRPGVEEGRRSWTFDELAEPEIGVGDGTDAGADVTSWSAGDDEETRC